MDNFSSKPKYFLYLLFCLLILVLYAQTLNFGYAIDDQLINENIPGRSDGLTGLLHIFQQRYGQIDYRPIVILSFSIEKWISGEINPIFSHFNNLMLFAFIIICIHKTVASFLEDEKYKIIVLISLLIFIAHPVHVEVVSNLKSRDNLLSCLFSILSIHFLLKFFFQKKKIASIVIGILFFIIALYSKLDAVGLIFLFPLILFITKKARLRTTLFYIILFYFIFNIVRFVIVDYFVPVDNTIAKNIVSFTENPLGEHSTFSDRIAAAALTFWYYIKIMIVPFGYRYYYGFDVVKLYSILTWQSIIAIIGIIASLLLIFKYFLHNRFILICCLGFISYLLYALNFITPVAGIIADRYVFISSLFFCGFVSFGIFSLCKETKLYYLVCIGIIILLSCFSLYRITAWKNQLTLIERDAPHLQNSYEAMRIATSTYIEFANKETNLTTKENLLNKAVVFAESGNAVYPKNVLLHKLQATAYLKLNKYSDAKTSLQTAIKNDSSDIESHTFLGDIFYLEKNLDSALFYYKKAFTNNPEDAVLINNISSIFYEKGEKDACINFNEMLLKNNDSLYAAWENLGYYFLMEKDTVKAVYYFENGFKYGLQNPEMAKTISIYLNKKKQTEKADYFLKFNQ